MRSISNIADLKFDQFSFVCPDPSKVETKAGLFFPAVHLSSKTQVTLMVNSERPLSKKSQNSFSLFPAATFEDEADLEKIFGAKNDEADSTKSHGKNIFQS